MAQIYTTSPMLDPYQAMITVMTWMSNRKEEGLLGFVTNNIPVSVVKGMPHPKM